MSVNYLTPDKSGAFDDEAYKKRLEIIHKTKLSPKGTFKINDALEEKRFKYGIVDNAFIRKAAFDKILAFQIPQEEGETYADTSIIMPTAFRKRAREEAPRAVIVDGGLAALDAMMSNGHQLGDTINFVRLTPYRIVVDWVNGQDIVLVVLHVGDICANEDLEGRFRSGEVRYEVVTDENGINSHILIDENGKRWKPQEPWIPEDY